MHKKDFIVVGSGLAGSILARGLVLAGKSVVMISDDSLPSSSRVAGGLINPVTGKYLAKTWMVDELFTELKAFYGGLEEKFRSSFYHRTGLFRPFTSKEHKKSSLAQIEKHELKEYITVHSEDAVCDQHFNCSDGGMFSPDAGWLDIPVFLEGMHIFLKQNTEWQNEQFRHSELSVGKDFVKYGDKVADKIIFCEGYFVKDNPLFNWLPFNPVKGETLLGTVKDYEIPYIVNQGKWLIPLGNDRVRLGATYSWHELDFETSEEARKSLQEVADKILKSNFVVEGQQAGVRPATKDRRPILGRHPEFESVYIFNGLGTKGVSLAPYFAKELTANLLHGKDINPEANIERFYALYS